ncbi:hypothetical protein SAMN04488056_11255 [Cohaesibacter marisflavi]|uniref:Beta-barrel assembly machine subunit BamF n=1 Tax=Cohaesibacter marisflavi TaxID=655353 RepID=A0A1I5JSK3_9HYPH|nr:hypothetical protein [Cohaesibacter marisflavi]SFO75483.1 hypothetical protein SAMN04488056_11255 [Cohaesibacter marisflavi]
MNEKIGLALSASLVLFLAGCSATHSDLASGELTDTNDVYAASTPDAANAQAGEISNAQASTIARVPFAPSQLGYSLDLLNEGPDTTDYPTITNLKDKDPSLLAPEERKKLEEELLQLNARAKQ